CHWNVRSRVPPPFPPRRSSDLGATDHAADRVDRAGGRVRPPRRPRRRGRGDPSPGGTPPRALPRDPAHPPECRGHPHRPRPRDERHLPLRRGLRTAGHGHRDGAAGDLPRHRRRRPVAGLPPHTPHHPAGGPGRPALLPREGSDVPGSSAGLPSRLPLTQGQAGIWYGLRLDPSGLAYVYAEYLDITGPLRPGLLREAARTTFAEAEALSTVFGEDADGPWQRIRAGREHAVPLVDLAGEADPWRAAQEWMRARVHSPLDPSAGEVARTA